MPHEGAEEVELSGCFPKLERPPVLALALVSFAGCALLASAAVLIAWACTEGNDGYEGHHMDDY